MTGGEQQPPARAVGLVVVEQPAAPARHVALRLQRLARDKHAALVVREAPAHGGTDARGTHHASVRLCLRASDSGFVPAIPGSGAAWPGPRTVRVSDVSDNTGASVDLDVADTGRILVARAIRPMTVGSRIVMTPWKATTDDFREVDGIRIPHTMEAAWNAPEGTFTYIRIELLSVCPHK